MAVFLLLNGYRIVAEVDEQETLILGVASTAVDREELAAWLREHCAETDQRYDQMLWIVT